MESLLGMLLVLLGTFGTLFCMIFGMMVQSNVIVYVLSIIICMWGTVYGRDMLMTAE